jgi:3'-5' exoribonuclease
VTKKSEEEFIKNLKPRERVKTKFIISDKLIKTARTGSKYIDFTLSDNTGNITGRMFSNNRTAEIYDSIGTGRVCEVIGTVDEYPPGSGSLNIKVDRIRECLEEEYHLDDFLRVSTKDRGFLMAQIDSTISEIQNDHLKDLLHAFFNDENFREEFYNSPSAKIHHHNYIGGLLEHTVGVLEICKKTCEIFPELNIDLLYTGAILHDIGKIKAYDYDKLSIKISEEGYLLDHLYISCNMIQERINKIGMPQKLSNKVLHLVLSHHGDVSVGWGSPVNPKIPEAVALHHADNLDAKVKGMLQKYSPK